MKASGRRNCKAPGLTFRPLTAKRWGDLERLFGERGACGGCWCMWWRLRRSEHVKGKGEPNKRAFRAIVQGGAVPGILAYGGREPVAWCAVEPRESYPVLERARTLRPLDDRPVCSVTCFFVRRASVGHAQDRSIRGHLGPRAARNFSARKLAMKA